MNDEHDVSALHAAVLREREEPTEGREPVPTWMIGGFILLIAWGGWYLGRYDARFDGSVADMQVRAAAAPAAAEAGPDLAALGAQVYGGRCAACHQGTGLGMAGVAPPLDGSEWVTGDTDRLIRVVLQGIQGPIEVKGESWNLAMPGWGATMSDEEVAAALTHARSAWTNRADPVGTEQVRDVRARTADRKTPWTAAEL